MFLQILQNSQKNTSARVSFFIKCNFAEFLRTTFFTEHLRWLLLQINYPLISAQTHTCNSKILTVRWFKHIWQEFFLVIFLVCYHHQAWLLFQTIYFIYWDIYLDPGKNDLFSNSAVFFLPKVLLGRMNSWHLDISWSLSIQPAIFERKFLQDNKPEHPLYHNIHFIILLNLPTFPNIYFLWIVLFWSNL